MIYYIRFQCCKTFEININTEMCRSVDNIPEPVFIFIFDPSMESKIEMKLATLSQLVLKVLHWNKVELPIPLNIERVHVLGIHLNSTTSWGCIFYLTWGVYFIAPVTASMTPSVLCIEWGCLISLPSYKSSIGKDRSNKSSVYPMYDLWSQILKVFCTYKSTESFLHATFSIPFPR